MTSSIDERIVSMKFNNAQFEQGIKTSLTSLANLKNGLNLDGAGKGLQDLSNTARTFSLGSLTDGLSNITGGFNALGIVGVTALVNIANKAVDAGLQMAKSLTVEPIMAGFKEYELKMGSVQTILANTARFGTTLDDVTSSLEELNTYADKTIYNFGDMTKAIGLFTNSGLELEAATSMIKGFSNEAAASGVSAEKAAGAAVQLSQGLASGVLTAIDWVSITSAGMGNKNMQLGLVDIAQAMGKFDGDAGLATEAATNFKGSLEKKWLGADVMSTYLQIMAGDMDAAAISAIGLTDTQVAGFLKQQKTAEEAATKVRTFTGLIGTLREAIGSGWSETFELLIGDFDSATELFTNVSNTLGGIAGDMSAARNKLIGDFVTLGGRDVVIDTLSNAFEALLALIKPIGEAFETIFPAVTARNLMTIVLAIRDFSETLKIGATDAAYLKRTFEGVFAIFSIGLQIIQGIIGMFVRLFSGADEGASSFIRFTAKIADFFIGLDKAMKSGDGLTTFFNGIADAIQVPLKLLAGLATAFMSLFTGMGDIDTSGFDGFFELIQTRLQPLAILGGIIAGVWMKLGEVFAGIGAAFAPMAKFMVDGFAQLADAIGGALKVGNFDGVLDVLNTGLFAGLVIIFKNFFGKITDSLGSGSGLFDSIGGVFGQLTSNLKTMQESVKADILLKIAIAVGVLAAAVLVLSTIDSGAMTQALIGIGVLFTELTLTMVALEKSMSLMGSVKIALLGASFVTLGIGILILAGAVKLLATMTWDEIVRGLAAMAGIMAILAVTLKTLPKSLILTGPGLLLASVGILALAVALKVLGTMSWDEIARSMVVLAASLTILGIALFGMSASIPGAAALLIASVALIALGAALKVFATLSWDDIGRAMVILGGSLIILAIGLTAMMATLPGAAALLIASVALVVLGAALKVFATLSWDDIGRAMVILGGTLLILAIGLTAMIAALPGAAALLVAAAALAVLAPVLVILGNMSWDQIGRGLTVLAAALGIIAIAGYVLIPVVPVFLLLGVAVALMGAGMLAAGVGIGAFAAGIAALAVAGAAGIGVIIAAVTALATLIPMIAVKIGEGLVAIIVSIADNSVAIFEALTKLAVGFLDVLITLIPKVVEVIVTLGLALVNGLIALIPPVIDALVLLITKLVEALIVLVPMLADAGLQIINGILTGIANNIQSIVEQGGNIIINFINGMAAKAEDIVVAITRLLLIIMHSIETNLPFLFEKGKQLIQEFITGLGSMASGVMEKAAEIIVGLITEFGAHVDEVIAAGTKVIVDFLVGIGQSIETVLTAGTEIILKLLAGISEKSTDVMTAATTVITTFLDEIEKNMETILTKGAAVLTKFLEGVGSLMGDVTTKSTEIITTFITEVDNNTQNIIDTGFRLLLNFLGAIANNISLVVDEAVRIIVNFINGLSENIHLITDAGANFIIEFVNSLSTTIDERGEEMRQAGSRLAWSIINGMTGGLWDGVMDVVDAAKAVARRAIEAAMNIFDSHSPSRVFMKIGGWASEGLGIGITKMGGFVEHSAENVGIKAIDKMKSTIGQVGDAFSGNVDINPRITPVLDLDAFKRDAKLIESAIRNPKMSISRTYDAATSISEEAQARRDRQQEEIAIDDNAPGSVNFTQNNYSPKALSPIEIYRQSKNAISIAKGGVKVVNET